MNDADLNRIKTFFQTFTTFGLFREPHFLTKLNQISSTVQTKALLAAVFAFACKGSLPLQQSPEENQLSATKYGDLAIMYAEEAMSECGDDVPPLCVLQTLILITHWLIIRGVRGKAWRYVGVCIRVLFEIGLNSIDTDRDSDSCEADPERWCRDEEGRRAYWAVWEMDQYTSHIKHLPITSDWTRDGVHLPAEDGRWLACRPQESCALALDLIDRCKNLQATGSKSTRAWYIVIASSLNVVSHEIAYSQKYTRHFSKGQIRLITDRWPVLYNTIQLSMIFLPQELSFHGQYLSFGTQNMGLSLDSSERQRHSAIYEIALMPEVSKIMALRPYVFDAYIRSLLERGQGGEGQSHAIGLSEESAQKVEQCFRAADNILNIILNCHDSHYRYVNPYVTQVSWLGATVQLLRQELTEDDSQKQLIRSKLEIFKATNEKFMQHWSMSRIPKENLETLEARLKQFTAASQRLNSMEDMVGTRMHYGPRPEPAPPISGRFDTGSPTHERLSCHTFAEGLLVPRTNSDTVRLKSEKRHRFIETDTGDMGRHSVESPLSIQKSPPSSQILDISDLAVPVQHSYEPSPNSTISPQNPGAILLSGSQEPGPQSAHMGTEPLDWLSIFSGTDFDAGLTDYLEMLSAPYPR